MSEKEKQNKTEQEKRIDELEAEVSHLREELQERENHPPLESPAEPSSKREAKNLAPVSRTKVVVAVIAILFGALVVFFVIFNALSSGFDSFARKAAQIFTPEHANSTDAPAPSPAREKGVEHPPNSAPPSSAPMAPGL
jgi:hypothetical protein